MNRELLLWQQSFHNTAAILILKKCTKLQRILLKLVENICLHVIIIMCLNLIRNSLKEEINTNFVKKVTVFYFKQH